MLAEQEQIGAIERYLGEECTMYLAEGSRSYELSISCLLTKV